MVNMVKDLVDEEQMGNMLTVQEVARLLHIHPNTLRRWSNRGLIKAYRITPRGDRRFRREEILDFLAKLNANYGDGRQPDNGQKS
jgi:excisionase family DNA binding protein